MLVLAVGVAQLLARDANHDEKTGNQRFPAFSTKGQNTTMSVLKPSLCKSVHKNEGNILLLLSYESNIWMW